MRCLRWTIRATFCICVLAAGCGGGSSTTATAPTAPTSVPVSTPTKPPLPTPPPATSCQAITTPGAFPLNADVGTPGSTASCLNVAVSGVTLDCHGHTVNGFIEIADGVSNVSVLNCTATGVSHASNLSAITIAGSTLTWPVSFLSAHGVVVRNNRIAPPGSFGGAVILEEGGNNQVLDNELDGGWQPTGDEGRPGTDDGVILADEDGDTIRGNTIHNVFDAGVEGVNGVTNTVISGNTISVAGIAGVGAYFCTAWQNNTVDGNQISQSPNGLRFDYQRGSCFQNPPPAAFTGNTFSNNRFSSVLGMQVYGLRATLDAGGGTVQGNAVRGNDFSNTSVAVSPADGFVNGGGNTCTSTATFSC